MAKTTERSLHRIFVFVEPMSYRDEFVTMLRSSLATYTRFTDVTFEVESDFDACFAEQFLNGTYARQWQANTAACWANHWSPIRLWTLERQSLNSDVVLFRLSGCSSLNSLARWHRPRVTRSTWQSVEFGSSMTLWNNKISLFQSEWVMCRHLQGGISSAHTRVWFIEKLPRWE